MPSFFRLKFGEKKKSKGQQWQPTEYSQIIEHRSGLPSFVKPPSIENKRKAINLMRALSRPGTAHSTRCKPFYESQSYHLAMGSVHDVSTMPDVPPPPRLKHSVSEMNIRTHLDSPVDLGVRPVATVTEAGMQPLGKDAKGNVKSSPTKSPLAQCENAPDDQEKEHSSDSPLDSSKAGLLDMVLTSAVDLVEEKNEAEEEQERMREPEERQETAKSQEERLELQKMMEVKLKMKPLPPTPPPTSLPTPVHTPPPAARPLTLLPPPGPPPQISLPETPTSKAGFPNKTRRGTESRSPNPSANDLRLAESPRGHGPANSGSSFKVGPGELSRKTPSPPGSPLLPEDECHTTSPPASSEASPRKTVNSDEASPGVTGADGPPSPGNSKGRVRQNTSVESLNPSQQVPLNPGLTTGEVPIPIVEVHYSLSEGRNSSGLDSSSAQPPMSENGDNDAVNSESLPSPGLTPRNVSERRETVYSVIDSPRRFSLERKIAALEQSFIQSVSATPSRAPSFSDSEYSMDVDHDKMPRSVSPPSPLRISPPSLSERGTEADSSPITVSPLSAEGGQLPPIPIRATTRTKRAGTMQFPNPVPSWQVAVESHSHSPDVPAHTATSLTPQFRQPTWAPTNEPSRPGTEGPPSSSRSRGRSHTLHIAVKSAFSAFHTAPLTPDSSLWPLTPGPPVSPLTMAGPAVTATTPATLTNQGLQRVAPHPYQQLAMTPPALVRARVPPPLNFDSPPHSVQRGPWTPLDSALGDGDLIGPGPGPDVGRVVPAGAPFSPALASSRPLTPVDVRHTPNSSADGALGTGRRPDFGLKSPTGYADQHGTQFI